MSDVTLGSAAAGLPTGTVTFLFTDVVGSTALWELAPREMGLAMTRHDVLAGLAQSIEQSLPGERIGRFAARADHLAHGQQVQRVTHVHGEPPSFGRCAAWRYPRCGAALARSRGEPA